jgi:hypothetical protein
MTKRKKAPEQLEWIGGTLKLPVYVEIDGDAPYQPPVVLWMNQDGAILSLLPVDGDAEDEALLSALTEAMERPALGSPSRPERVRLADPALAQALVAKLEDIEVIVAPTPELDLAVETITEIFELEGAGEGADAGGDDEDDIYDEENLIDGDDDVDDDEGTSYNPMEALDTEEWLALEEGERFDRVREHHLSRRSSHPVPEGFEAHVAAHVIAENQIAMNEPPETRRALERLIADGLDRHEAVHAIGFIVTQHVMEMLRSEARSTRASLSKSLDALDAQVWRRMEA